MEKSCEKCKDRGYYSVIQDSGMAVGYCRCAAGRAMEYEIPKRFALWTWDSFPGDPIARDTVRSWCQNGCPPWLLLMGSVGAGKTGLAVCAHKELQDAAWKEARACGPDDSGMDFGVEWKDATQMLQDIKRTFDANSDESDEFGGYDPLTWFKRRAKVLTIDDRGAERPTEWAQETIREILRSRYDHVLRTIITTNLSGSELEGWIGTRAMDRLKHDTLIVNLPGQSLRKPGI